MRSIVTGMMILMAGAAGAEAGTSSGSGALALAALVGVHAPSLAGRDRAALAALLDDHLVFAFPAHRDIVVAAKTVSCRSSDVDIAAHSCTLTFGSTRTLRGRAAHELYATLIENGVAGDGAAGSIFEAVSQLRCTVTPDIVKQRGGGGANCTFAPGP